MNQSKHYELPDENTIASLEDIFFDETNNIREKLNEFKNKEKGKTLHVSDLDDTIISRDKTLQRKGMQINRGEKGNIYLKAFYSGIINDEYHGEITDEITEKVNTLSSEEISKALMKFAKQHYAEETDGEDILGPVTNIQTLIKRTSEITNLILTAGIEELQKLKLEYIGLSDIPLVVVEKGKEKLAALIRYIINNLGYIPRKIIINEDRPEFFIKYGQILANELSTNIIINIVNIDGNNEAKTLKTNNYLPNRGIL